MKNRPLIGINTDYRASAKGRAPHSFMHSGYYDCLLSANAVPVMIPPLIKEHDLAPILDQAHKWWRRRGGGGVSGEVWARGVSSGDGGSAARVARVDGVRELVEWATLSGRAPVSGCVERRHGRATLTPGGCATPDEVFLDGDGAIAPSDDAAMTCVGVRVRRESGGESS